MRLRPLLAVLALGLVATTVPAASAASLGQVGTVSFVGNSPSALTLDWPSVRGATAYQVYRSTSISMSGAVLVSAPGASSAKVGGLTPGRTYCFQVRATRGATAGYRSARTCKPTVRAHAGVSGAKYSVMTFNACTDVCSGWSRRKVYAARMVAARKPDVLATQEANSWTTAPSGYGLAATKSAKRLFYKKSRFAVGQSGRRAGSITLSTGKYAVWAELVDRANGKRIIFTSVHTSAARSSYARRGAEVRNLMSRMRSINTAGLPVVYAGDFNSNKSRGTYSSRTGFGSQDTVSAAFAAAGYYDSYDLATSLKRPNWNSYSAGRSTPTIGKTWGDHVDHLYVLPGRAEVTRWMNAALYSGSRYASPAPSDHSPVMVDLYLR